MTDIEMLSAENARLTKLVIELRAEAVRLNAQAEQTDARDAARWRYLAWHIGVAWNEQGFTSLVRIVSDKHRAMLGDMVDRMMAGDLPEAAPQPAQQRLKVTDAMAYAFHGAISDGSLGSEEVEDIKRGLAAAFANYEAAPQPLTDEQIKRIMLNNGFTIKEGLTDLKPYVYAAARALIAAATGVKND